MWISLARYSADLRLIQPTSLRFGRTGIVWSSSRTATAVGCSGSSPTAQERPRWLALVASRPALTPDGTQVLLSRSESADIVALTLDGTRRLQTVHTPAVERNGVVSPDGRWLAYDSDSAGRFEIYVRPFRDVNLGPWLVSTDGGHWPLWAPPRRRTPSCSMWRATAR